MYGGCIGTAAFLIRGRKLKGWIQRMGCPGKFLSWEAPCGTDKTSYETDEIFMGQGNIMKEMEGTG